MPANADNSNAKRAGNHPSSPQKTRKPERAAASPSRVMPGAALQGTIVWLGRKKLGWSQEVLAGKSNYDVKTIQNVENGRTTKSDTFRVLRDLLVKELANGNFPTLEKLLAEKQQHDAAQSKPAPALPKSAPAEEEIPDPIQKLINRAKKLTDDDRFGEAIPGLEKALKLAGEAKHHSAEAKIRLRLGHALFEGREEYTGAEEHFRKALELVGESPSVTRHAALHGLADMLLWARKLDEAGAVIQASLEVAKSLGDQDAIARSLISLALLERSLGRSETAEKHLDDAIRAFHQLALTLKGEKRQENAHALAVCYQNKAQLKRDDGKLEEALALHVKVEELHRESGDRLNAGKIHLLTGKLHCANADAEKGFQCFKRAIKIFLELKNQMWMARVAECMARLYAQHERWKEAIEPAFAAVDGFKEAGRSGEQVMALLFAARLAAKHHEWAAREFVRLQIHEISKSAPKDKEAEIMAKVSEQIPRVHEEIDEKVRNHTDLRSLLNEAKSLAEKQQLHEELAECFLAEMHLLTRKEDKEKRRQFLEDVIAVMKNALDVTSAPKRRGHLMGELSGLYRSLGNKAESIMWLRRAGEIFEQSGDVFGLANYHGSLAELHRKNGSLEDEVAAYKKGSSGKRLGMERG